MKKISFFICLIALVMLICSGCDMQYRVYFNEFDGSQTYQDIQEGQKATCYTPVKEGYEFLGWYTEEDELFDFDTPITKNIKLYAYYGMKEWTITFIVDANDASKNFTQKVSNNHLVILPTDPVKEDYIFMGWVRNSTLFNFDTTYITSDITISAYFEKDSEYTPKLNVTFNSLDGGDFASISVRRLEKIESLPTPNKEGYEFLGWFLGSTQITTDTVIREISDFTLTAHYSKK